MAIVDKNVDRHGTRKVAEAFLNFLYTPAAQEIEARDFYRPRNQARFWRSTRPVPDDPAWPPSTAISAAGARPRPTHFAADGGVFDQIYQSGK